MSNSDYKVSVITPCYNDEKFIGKTIKSVINQTYENLEMIIVDDCSTDRSVEIIKGYMKKDPRIKLIENKVNSGAGVSRNNALRKAGGRFIAYLDGDDLWTKDKLEKQIAYMIANDVAFTCASYGIVDEKDKSMYKNIYMPKVLDYKGFLENNYIQTLGVVLDTEKINKALMEMPDIRMRQDAATWLKILKEGYKCVGLKDVLGYYRKVKGSLSSNKFKAARKIWLLYYKVENLGFFYSLYCYIRYAIVAIKKRMYIRRWYLKVKRLFIE